MAETDENMRRAFVELQGKMMENVSSMKQAHSNMQGRESTKRRSMLTAQELSEVQDDTNCYKGIGKAYFLSSKKDLIAEMEENVKECDEDLDKLKGQQAYYEKNIKEVEANIRELLQSNPTMAQEIALRKTGAM